MEYTVCVVCSYHIIVLLQCSLDDVATRLFCPHRLRVFLARFDNPPPPRTFSGNSTATARDPARGGSTFGPLEVMADLKEPVSALKARMAQKAAESGFIVAGDDKER